MQKIFCPSAGIVLTRVCWYRNAFVGEASLVMSPETTFCGAGVAMSSLLISTAKSWSEADARLQLKPTEHPEREGYW